MKAHTPKKSVFHRVRSAITGSFRMSQKREDDRLKRGAELFVDHYSETMKMLANESKKH